MEYTITNEQVETIKDHCNRINGLISIIDNEGLLTERLLSLISEKDKDILFKSLLTEKKTYLEAQKVKQQAIVTSVDTQLSAIDSYIK